MATRRRSLVPKMKGVEAFLSPKIPSMDPEFPQTGLCCVPLDSVVMASSQPRRYFDPAKLAQLAESIKQHGILEPLLVRPLTSGQYELVAGERRYKAAHMAGLQEVPITSRNLSNREAWQLSLIENLQREDLNPVEETEGVLELLTLCLDCERRDIYRALAQLATAHKRGSKPTENIARFIDEIEKILKLTLGITPDSFRTSRLPLLKLPEDVLQVIREGKLEYTKARAIARVKDDEPRQMLLEQAIAKNMPLTEIQSRIKVMTEQRDSPPDRVLAQRWAELGRRLQRSHAWRDRQKRDRITQLLNELEQLTAG